MSRRLWVSLLVIAGILLVARTALPALGKHAINWTLTHKMENYTGHLEDFDLSLYRGAYQLQGLRIWKKTASEQTPLISAEEIDLSLSWRSLVQGRITANVFIDGLRVRISDSKDAEKRQYGTDEKNWRDVADALFPISIENLQVERSEFHFLNSDLKEPLGVKISQVHGQVRNLRNRVDPGLAEAPFDLRATLQDHADLVAEGRINVLVKPMLFDLEVRLRGFDLSTVNKFLLAYIPLDITRGTLDLDGEAAGSTETFKGYAKVFVENGDVIAPKQEVISFRHGLFELISAFGHWFVKNAEAETAAARLPFERESGRFSLNSSETFWSALKNSWDALPRGLEHSVSLGN